MNHNLRYLIKGGSCEMSKDWTGTSESIFKQLGASDHSKDEREENDYYATDPRAIDDLLKKESLDHNIWECASGGGHLVNRLREHGFNVYSTDLVDRGFQDDIIDFLKCEKTFDGDIVTNPPYKYCTEFILKALSLVNEGNKVAMFLKLTTLEGGERYRELYSKYPPQYIYI